MVTKVITIVMLFLILAFLFYITHQVKNGKSIILVFGSTPVSFTYPSGQTAQSTGTVLNNNITTKSVLKDDYKTLTQSTSFDLKSITG